MLRRRPDLPRHMVGGMGKPAGRACDLSWIFALSHSRIERARDHWPSGIVGVLSHDQTRMWSTSMTACESAQRSSSYAESLFRRIAQSEWAQGGAPARRAHFARIVCAPTLSNQG